jgi:hypothetical protein
MVKASFETPTGTVELDTDQMEKRVLENLKGEAKILMEGYFASKDKESKEKGSKGIVESFSADKKGILLEEFKKGSSADANRIKEQWTIVVPKYAVNELAGHLRDYVWVTDVVKGAKGETVNIPVVNDIEFQHVTAKTGTFTRKEDLINVITTTLHESGAYHDVYYGDLEKIDGNMLDEINRVFAHAAVRAEDYDLIYLLNTATTGQFMSEGGGSSTKTPAYVGTVSGTEGSLCANYVIDALVALMKRGKDVKPGECILYTNATGYGDLLKNIVGSTPMTYGYPEIVQKGLVEDFLGVTIVVGAARAKNNGFTRAGSTYDVAYLFRPKRALALAPKRDILIETDKLIATRQLRIAASHTYGVAAIDYTEVMPIFTKRVTNVIDNVG